MYLSLSHNRTVSSSSLVGGWVGGGEEKTIDRSRLANICNDKLLGCGITQANTNTHLLFSLGLSLFTNRAPRASLKYRNRQGKKKVCQKIDLLLFMMKLANTQRLSIKNNFSG